MLKFSRREDYAIIIINELVKNHNSRLVPLSEIAKDYSISLYFLRNLAFQLKNAGLIKATEGKSGGYYLAKKPENIKMGEILKIFASSTLLNCCSAKNSKSKNTSRVCPQASHCVSGNAWRRLNKEFLDKIYALSLVEFLGYN